MIRRKAIATLACGLATAAAPSAADPVTLRRSRGLGEVRCRNQAECIRVLANGSRPAPASAEDLRTVAALDPWTLGARPIVDIGLIASSDPQYARTLLDLHEQFDIVEPSAADFSAYKLLIAPQPVAVARRKLDDYRKFGGALFTPASARELAEDSLRSYVPKPAVIAAPGLPPEAEVTFLERRTPGGIRRTGFVLYYLEDGKPGLLTNVQLSFRLPQHPLGVITVPDQKPLEFVHNEFLTTFTLARVHGFQAIAFE